MQPQGLSNYNYGNKRNWRRWAWNRLKENLNLPTQDAVVLYLPGPRDFDSRIAMQKGFQKHNLIAVDIDEDRIKQVRKNGGIGICGDLASTILSWSPEVPINGIIADLCHGLTKKILPIEFAFLYSDGLKFGAACVINLQRGRDQYSNSVRKKILNVLPEVNKNRASFFLVSLVADYLQAIYKQWNKLGIRLTAENQDRLFWMLFKEFNPQFKTYTTSNSRIRMDSASFFYPGSVTKHFGPYKVPKQLEIKGIKVNSLMTRKIAAAKALRTMRMAS